MPTTFLCYLVGLERVQVCNSAYLLPLGGCLILEFMMTFVFKIISLKFAQRRNRFIVNRLIKGCLRLLKSKRMKVVLLGVLLVFVVSIGVYIATTLYITKSNVPADLVGTYVQQTTTGPGQSMELIADRTFLIQASANSTCFSGTWKVLDDKTVETSMQLLRTTIVGKFNVFDNDLVSKQDHNLWLKK